MSEQYNYELLPRKSVDTAQRHANPSRTRSPNTRVATRPTSPIERACLRYNPCGWTKVTLHETADCQEHPVMSIKQDRTVLLVSDKKLTVGQALKQLNKTCGGAQRDWPWRFPVVCHSQIHGSCALWEQLPQFLKPLSRFVLLARRSLFEPFPPPPSRRIRHEFLPYAPDDVVCARRVENLNIHSASCAGHFVPRHCIRPFSVARHRRMSHAKDADLPHMGSSGQLSDRPSSYILPHAEHHDMTPAHLECWGEVHRTPPCRHRVL